jgi:hypothetical protein
MKRATYRPALGACAAQASPIGTLTMDNSADLAAPSSDVPDGDGPGREIARLIDPKPLVETGRNWTKWFGPIVSLLILAAVVYQLRDLDFGDVGALMPSSPVFWLVFAVSYVQAPFSEWVMFKRLWELPFVGGMAALLRKFVSNEILLGYLGEVYFYAWARRHVGKIAAPFGAIKDVTILSALTGNIATIAMVILSAPMLGQLHLGVRGDTFALSIGFVLGTSILFLLLRKSLFTLPRPDLWFVTNIHFVRILSYAALMGLLWHLILPEVALTYWLLLATMRQLLSRLPFMPNKDVIFVGLASFIVGRDTDIVNAMALLASLTLAAHVAVGLTLGLTGLLKEKEA